MRIKIKESVLTIPDKLISQLDELDVETANAINTLLAKGERLFPKRNKIQQEKLLKLKYPKQKRKSKMPLIYSDYRANRLILIK